MVENFERVHVAVPLPEDMYFAWVIEQMKLTEQGRFPEMKGVNPPPHMTIYYLGRVNTQELDSAKQVVQANSEKLIQSKLRVIGLAIIGSTENQALVFGVENTEELKKFRGELEASLPQYIERNYPLNPHFTITELRTKKSIKIARNIVLENLPKRNKSEPTTIRSVGVYYHTK